VLARSRWSRGHGRTERIQNRIDVVTWASAVLLLLSGLLSTASYSSINGAESKRAKRFLKRKLKAALRLPHCYVKRLPSPAYPKQFAREPKDILTDGHFDVDR
jgi:acetylornithine deacetylase/succinyl-diaminopimelate desuccinylase-like protein